MADAASPREDSMAPVLGPSPTRRSCDGTAPGLVRQALDGLEAAILADVACLVQADRSRQQPDWRRLAVIGLLPGRFRDRYDAGFAVRLAGAASALSRRCRSGPAWPESLAEYVVALCALDRASMIRDLTGLTDAVPLSALAVALGIDPPEQHQQRTARPPSRAVAGCLDAIVVDPSQWFADPIRLAPPRTPAGPA